MSEQWETLKLQKDDLTLIILPGIGGRLWDINFREQSLLFQNPDLYGLSFAQAKVKDLPTRSPQFAFPLWGGEKTWIAPDALWVDNAPFSTLDSGPYEITASSVDHVAMTSGICPVSQLSVHRVITVHSAREWNISHIVTNHGDDPRKTGIWSVMMIETPAKIGVMTDVPKIHSVFGDAGSMIAQHENCLVADCATQQEFKVGLPNSTGQTVIKFGVDGSCLRCAVPKPSPTDRYAHQFPVEIFNSGDYPYCEAEWHSPFSTLSTGETLEFQQNFQIFPKDCPTATIIHKDLYTCMS